MSGVTVILTLILSGYNRGSFYLLSLMRMLSSHSEQVTKPQMVGLCTHELWPGNETSGTNNHISVY